MNPKRIAVIVGSLRKESFNRKMALNLVELARPKLELEILAIGQLAIYNQDLDDNPPEQWLEFRNQVKSYEGFIFVTPEYNRSVPAVLKNAVDIGSRPYGQSAWEGKPAAVMSVSPSKLGGFGANHHLRQSLVFLNMPVMQQPEAYIGDASKIFDQNGKLSASTSEFAQAFVASFASWVDQLNK